MASPGSFMYVAFFAFPVGPLLRWAMCAPLFCCPESGGAAAALTSSVVRRLPPQPPRGHVESRAQPLLPDAERQDQSGFRAARVVVLGYGLQPVVERSPPQGEPLADHAEPAPVVERDRGVELKYSAK